MDIKIIDVIAPSEKQKENNILGTVNLEIVTPNGNTIAKLMGLTVRKNQKGERFLASPSYKVSGKDGDKWYNHFSIFPPKGEDQTYNDSQRKLQQQVTDEVLRSLDNGGTKRNNTAPQGSKPAATSSAAAPKTDRRPWD
jgi:hypothetical protein